MGSLALEWLNLLFKQEGQDLIEYALTGLLIALDAITEMSKIASSVNAGFAKIADKLI